MRYCCVLPWSLRYCLRARQCVCLGAGVQGWRLGRSGARLSFVQLWRPPCAGASRVCFLLRCGEFLCASCGCTRLVCESYACIQAAVRQRVLEDDRKWGANTSK